MNSSHESHTNVFYYAVKLIVISWFVKSLFMFIPLIPSLFYFFLITIIIFVIYNSFRYILRVQSNWTYNIPIEGSLLLTKFSVKEFIDMLVQIFSIIFPLDINIHNLWFDSFRTLSNRFNYFSESYKIPLKRFWYNLLDRNDSFISRERHAIHIITSEKYDYLIVGAGTSGCILAKKLSENPKKKVVLIDYGEFPDYRKNLPIFSYMDNITPYSFGLNDKRDYQMICGDHGLKILRGTIFGGTSNASFGHYIDPPNEWWDYLNNQLSTDVFGNISNENVNSQFLSKTEFLSAFIKYFKKVAKLISVATVDAVGLYRTHCDVYGKKLTPFEEHLHPILHSRQNLIILTRTNVKQIVLESNHSQEDNNIRAIGLILEDKIVKTGLNMEHTVYGDKIILAAGSVSTPRILLKSGIGSRHKIPKSISMMVESDWVGKNVMDHYGIEMRYRLKTLTAIDLLMQEVRRLGVTKDLSGERAFQNCKSSLVTNFECGLFLKIKLPTDLEEKIPIYENTLPNLHIMFGSVDIPINLNKGIENLFAPKQVVIWILVNTMGDEERGELSFQGVSNDLTMHLHHQWNQSKRIKYILSEGIKIVKNIMSSTIIQPIVDQDMQQFEFTDANIFRTYLDIHDGCYGSIQGSCRFGMDIHDGVVGNNFSVHGTNGLYICDASVFRDLTPCPPISALTSIADICANFM